MNLPTITVDGITYEVETDPFGQECRYDMTSPGERCPVDGHLLSTHIGEKPCITSEPRKVSSIFGLPIARWAWEGDAAALRA